MFDVAHHSEIHNKNLPAQPGQDYCNSYEWYHLTLGFVKAHVLGKRRVTKESFERWYASQTDYRTVEDQELDADIMASTYGLPEMARMLGVHRQTIYYIVANEDFELIKVGRYKRATKESFEKWYHNQTRYQLAEDRQERS